MSTKNLGMETFSENDYVSVTPFNTNFNTLDTNLADSVIDRGMSGEWWFRKWRNGRYECGIEFKWFDNSNLTKVGGNGVFGVSKDYSFGNYPITFIGRPYTCITFEDENGGRYGTCHAWIATNKQVSKKESPKFRVLVYNGTAPIKPACGIHVIGRWK